jgi:ABC-type transport system substrate-binding protein
VVYGHLYRYDTHYGVLPDLADDDCFVPGSDGAVIRCRLIETTFHDGAPLTADDVAYTYDLYLRPTIYNAGSTGSLKEVRVIDQRTVDFVLSSVDPTFLNGVLPTIPILSRSAVEAAYADFASRTASLAAADLMKLADTIDEETNRETPVCTTRVEEVATLLEQLGVRLYREDFSRATGRFEACTFMTAAGGWLRQAAAAREAATDPNAGALDAVAAAFQLLSTDWEPIGTGPYRFVSESAAGVRVEAWPGYHGGPAATRYIDFVPANADEASVLAGTVDIQQGVGNGLGADFRATADSHGLRVGNPPQSGFYSLQLNVRPGRLFADQALRQALQLCIDLPRDVDAATGGVGVPVYGPVLPGSWADEPDLPKPARDVAAAKTLIEGAGWQPGADGVYAKGGAPLAATILVRADSAYRGTMADLIALQARDCGMDLQVRPMTWDETTTMFGGYPHLIPGTDEPFDVYLGGWIAGADPDDGLSIFASSSATDAEHPDNANYGGFSDAAYDALLEAGKSTYDQAERARIYQQAQQELASQLPAVFLFANESYDVVRTAVATVDGPLDLDAPNWSWQPERMVVAASSP